MPLIQRTILKNNILKYALLTCRRKMCILFMYNGSSDVESDYSLIVASNRDEYYRRPSQNMGLWSEDPNIVGGRDLEANCGGGSWLAISPLRKRLGVLLNLPRVPKPDAKSRGTIVAGFVKTDTPAIDYIESMKSDVKECNQFVFVAVELSNLSPSIHTYSNANDQLTTHTDTYLGFSNSLPDIPLKKVEAGRMQLKEICSRLNKVQRKQELVNELVGLLKSEVRHLPDPELEKRRPALSQHLSSIFVCIPEGGYGTRTHTLVLLTKTGHVDVIEITLQPPIDIQNPIWQTTEFNFEIKCRL